MRPTIFLSLAILAVTGCSSMSTTTQPAPRVIRDHKTPVAMPKSSVSQRIMEQRLQSAQIASGGVSVEGQVTR